MAKYKYEVSVWYHDSDSDDGPEFVQGFDNLKEARAKARHYLTDEYMRSCEHSRPYGYAQLARSESTGILEEFWAK